MKTYRVILIDDKGNSLSTQHSFTDAALLVMNDGMIKSTLRSNFEKILDELDKPVADAPITAKQFIAKDLFGTYVRLRNKDTGEEVLVTKMHWITMLNPGRNLVEFDGILPDEVHAFESSRTLYNSSVRRIVDIVGDRKWEEVK